MAEQSHPGTQGVKEASTGSPSGTPMAKASFSGMQNEKGVQNEKETSGSATVEKRPSAKGAESPFPAAISNAERDTLHEEAVARLLATIVFGATAVFAISQAFSGLMWSSIIRLASGSRIAKYLGFKLGLGHVLVCGVGETGLQLIREFHELGDYVVAIEKNPEDELLPDARSAGALVVIGDASKSNSLREAGIRGAKCIIGICDRDDTNVEIAVRASELLRKPPRLGFKGVRCVIHVADLQLATLFRQHRLLAGGNNRLTVRIFNFFENSARLLFQNFPLEPPRFRPDDTCRVHLVIVGFGQMGRSLALQAAKVAHYANGEKLRLSVIDKKANERRNAIYSSHPYFSEVCDIELFEDDAEAASMFEKMSEWSEDRHFITTYAICFDDDHRSLGFALRLTKYLKPETPIRVRMASQTGLASLLKGVTNNPEVPPHISAFGLLSDACGVEQILSEKLDLLAQAIHQAFVERRKREGRPASDPSMAPWEQLEQDFVDSNRQQADHVGVKLRAVGCSLDGRGEQINRWDARTEELLAKMEHARWKAERRLAGWRPASQDEGDSSTLKTKKLSPLLVGWEKLGETQKEWDRESVREIPRLLGMVSASSLLYSSLFLLWASKLAKYDIEC